jgi:lipopolysaccharide export system ATP-binding protein
MDSPHILSIAQLSKHFGGIHALNGIDLHIAPGEILGLIGPNGAGKTALINTITGFYQADSGQMNFMGHSLIGRSLHDIGRLGIGRTFQNIRLFKRMSVLENVMVANKSYAAHPWLAFWGFRKRGAAVDEAMQWLHTMHLDHKADASAQSLSYGEARRLEIARALATGPRFILLDEPFAGIDPIAVIEIQRIIAFLKERGIGVLITDHNVRETLGICDHAYIISEGRVLAQGTPKDIVDNADVRRVYLGEHFRM